MLSRKHAITALLLIALTAFAIGVANAGTITATWTNPTQREDNSPLPANQIGLTRVEYGTCNAGQTAIATKVGEVTATGAATTTVATNVPAGTYCVRARTEDTGSLASAWTAVVTVTIPVAPPKPPTGLATTGTIAFNIVKQTDRFVLVPVGTVPSGVACDSTQSVNGHNVVPRSSVTWSGNVRPAVVVAACAAS
jgi:hypothetical protein